MDRSRISDLKAYIMLNGPGWVQEYVVGGTKPGSSAGSTYRAPPVRPSAGGGRAKL